MLKAPHLWTLAASSAWQRSLEIDGQWIAGIAVLEELVEGRGWLAGFPTTDLTSAGQILPLIREFRALQASGHYRELRAWIYDGAQVEERFAQWCGLRLDCGPASGYSPTGRDMNLWLWRSSI